jgi:hypothetical protein
MSIKEHEEEMSDSDFILEADGESVKVSQAMMASSGGQSVLETIKLFKGQSRRKTDMTETTDEEPADFSQLLTQAQDFNSLVEAKKQLKQQWAEEQKPMLINSERQGNPPVTQRLVWLVKDFLMACELEISEMFAWQQSNKLTGSLNSKKSSRLTKLMKELFKKYQLAILKPNLNHFYRQ